MTDCQAKVRAVYRTYSFGQSFGSSSCSCPLLFLFLDRFSFPTSHALSSRMHAPFINLLPAKEPATRVPGSTTDFSRWPGARTSSYWYSAVHCYRAQVIVNLPGGFAVNERYVNLVEQDEPEVRTPSTSLCLHV